MRGAASGRNAEFVKPRAADLQLLEGWIAGGQVRPDVERSFPLAEAAEAQRLSETGRVRGKIVRSNLSRREAQLASANNGHAQ